MKKCLLLVISIILLSGCTAEYNLDFDDDKFVESLNIETTSDHLDYENVKNYSWPKSIDYRITGASEAPEKVEGVTYYDYDSYEDEEKAGFTYSYTMNAEQYRNSAIVHSCFSNVSLITNEKNSTYTLQTSNGFECFSKYPPLEKVTINIKTDKNVVDTNADSIKGNIYSWEITAGNASSKNIMLSTSTKEVVEEKETNIILILIILAVFFIGIIVLIKVKNKKYRGN